MSSVSFGYNNSALNNNASSAKLREKVQEASASVMSGNKENNAYNMSNENMQVLSTSSYETARIKNFRANSAYAENTAKKLLGGFTNIVETSAELSGALAGADSSAILNASEKVLSVMATILSMYDENGNQVFSGKVDSDNIRGGINNYDNTNHITTAGFMTEPSTSKPVELRCHDEVDMGFRPEDLKDFIGATQEVKRLSGLNQVVPQDVKNVFNKGIDALSKMNRKAHSIANNASNAVNEHRTTLSEIKQNLKNSMGADQQTIAKELANYQNIFDFMRGLGILMRQLDSVVLSELRNYGR